MTCHRCKKNQADVMVPIRTVDGKTVEQIELCLDCGWEMIELMKVTDEIYEFVEGRKAPEGGKND